MCADLAVYELEAAPGIGNLLAEVRGELGKKVAVFASGSFGVAMQLANLAAEQRVPLRIEGGDVALGVLDLARDAKKLSDSAFAGNRGVDLAMIVKETLQRFGVTTAVGLVGAGHQQGEVLLLGVVAREVGVDALGDVSEESLKAGRWIELFGFVRIPICGIMGLLRTLASLLGSSAGGVGIVEVDFAFGDPRFEIVEFCVEDADLTKVSAFEGLELGTDLGKLRFTLGERGPNSSKLLAFVEEGGVVRGLLEDDFGRHAASREGKF
jgi:hypothetical protein